MGARSTRRIASVLAAMLALLLALSSATFAQMPEKPMRVGILVGATLEQRGHLEQAFLQALREQGYVEGRNLLVERRYAEGDGGRLPEYASQLAGMKLDVIITTCSPSTRAMKQATTSTPIVMAAVADPVGQLLVSSLAHPGANVTGLASQADELLPKRLEQLVSVLPKANVVAVLSNAINVNHAMMRPALEAAAGRLNLKLVFVSADTPARIPAAIDAAAREQASALFVLPDDPMLLNFRKSIVERAAHHRLPGFYWASEFVEDGGLLSYGENLRASYRSAASYAQKVARGAKPADMPVAQPTRFELAINRTTASALGLTLPNELLLRADEVIQ
jgi:putative tryptophan/tyrosine transport system substrate-binding protein